MSEEEAFWMFTAVIETLIPMDYYCKMLGVILDHNILNELIKEKFPDLFDFLLDNYYDPKTHTFQWFSCFFSYNFSFEVIARIWDLFFLKGIKIIFRVSLAIIHIMKKFNP